MTEPLRSPGSPSSRRATSAAPAEELEELDGTAAPLERPAPGRPRHLRVVEPASRRRSLGGRTMFLAGAGVVIAVAFALVYLHVLMAQRQMQIDSLTSQVSQAQSQYQSLRLQVAELDSPQHVIWAAEGQLHMRQPASVTYLSPRTGSAATGATSGLGVAPKPGKNGTIAAPSGDANWPKIKADLAGSP